MNWTETDILAKGRAVKERPILMSAPMVRAILDGRKTQTRRTDPLLDAIKDGQPAPKIERICKRWGFLGTLPDAKEGDLVFSPCRFGGPGDRLWVKETFACGGDLGPDLYRADGEDARVGRRTHSIFMPRLISRITLEITGVRVERLTDISEEDARAEGVTDDDDPFWTPSYHDPDSGGRPSHRNSFHYLWESINGDGSWQKNPFCWVIEFRRIES